MFNFDFSERGLGLVSPPHFVYDFLGKMFHSCYILLTDQTSLPDCLYSRDIGQYVRYNCLLARLWSHKIWNQPYLSYQAVLLHDQKVKTKTSIILRTRGAFDVKWKAFFITFKGLLADKNCLRPESAPLKNNHRKNLGSNLAHWKFLILLDNNNTISHVKLKIHQMQQ